MQICHSLSYLKKKMVMPQGLLLWCSAFFSPRSSLTQHAKTFYSAGMQLCSWLQVIFYTIPSHVVEKSLSVSLMNDWTLGPFFFFSYVTHWTQRGWFRGLQKSSQQCPEVFGGQVMRYITLSAQSLHCESQFQPSVPQNDTMRLYPSVGFVRPVGGTHAAERLPKRRSRRQLRRGVPECKQDVNVMDVLRCGR